MQYCSLQHQTLLLSPVTSTTGCCFCFGSVSSFFLELFLHWSPVACWAPTHLGSSSFSVLSFCLSYCSWGSQGKNTEVVCHSLLQWTTFCQNSPSWPICLGWPYMAWLIVSWTTQLFNSLKHYEPCHVGPPKTDGSWWRGLTKCGPLEKRITNHFSILALRTPWTIWKGKKTGHWNMNFPVQMPSMLLEIGREVTPETMKRRSQSKNNTQLWMWLVMEVKPDAVKSNTA